MGNPIVHFEIQGKDGEALKSFYSGLFGWKIDSNNPMNYGVVDTDSGDGGLGGGVATSQDGNPSAVIYVGVPDIDSKLKEIEAAGGKVTFPKMVIPDMVTFAQFSDPEGNVVGLVESDSH